MKIDPTVKKETLYVCLVTLILSVLMQAVFLVIGRWEISVLFGNLLGAGTGIINFFLMGLGIQKAVSSDEKKAREIMRGSHSLRFALMIVLLAVALIFRDYFDIIATLASLLFATMAVYLRMFSNKDKKTAVAVSPEGNSVPEAAVEAEAKAEAEEEDEEP